MGEVKEIEEIERLKIMLEAAGIPFKYSRRYSASSNTQISYPTHGKQRKCSVIQGQYTYGGKENLLEIMGLLTDEEREEDCVAGWLTAEEVFRRIKLHWDLTQKAGQAL